MNYFFKKRLLLLTTEAQWKELKLKNAAMYTHNTKKSLFTWKYFPHTKQA